MCGAKNKLECGPVKWKGNWFIVIRALALAAEFLILSELGAWRTKRKSLPFVLLVVEPRLFSHKKKKSRRY
jgi:hypothetical protein